MKTEEIRIRVTRCKYEELDSNDRQLADTAKTACQNSYSPYSHFCVGAALRLSDETVIQGSNQENVAYPNGMCAERIVLYHAGASHPHKKVKALAIAACTKEGIFTNEPCAPCGACRQVLMETEKWQGDIPVKLILYGKEECILIEDGAKALLPIQFKM